MAGRRNNNREENLATLLIYLPWQASAVVAAFAFAVMRWVFPMAA